MREGKRGESASPEERKKTDLLRKKIIPISRKNILSHDGRGDRPSAKNDCSLLKDFASLK